MVALWGGHSHVRGGTAVTVGLGSWFCHLMMRSRMSNQEFWASGLPSNIWRQIYPSYVPDEEDLGVLHTLQRFWGWNWSESQIKAWKLKSSDAPSLEDSIINLYSSFGLFLALNRLNDATHSGEKWPLNLSTHMLMSLEIPRQPIGNVLLVLSIYIP